MPDRAQPMELPSAEAAGEQFAAEAGAADLAALRDMTAAEILAVAESTQAEVAAANVDGWVFPKQIAEIFAAGEHNDVDLIVGLNADEGTNLLPPRDPDAAWAGLGRLVGATFMDEVRSAYDNGHGRRGPVLRRLPRHGVHLADARVGAPRSPRRTRTCTATTSPSRQRRTARRSPRRIPRGGNPVRVQRNEDFCRPSAWAANPPRAIAHWAPPCPTTGWPSRRPVCPRRAEPQWPRFEIASDAYLEFGDAIEARQALMPTRLDLAGRIVPIEFDD